MSDSLHIEISLDDQELALFRSKERIQSFPISSAEKGMGFEEGSFRTPIGNFVISEKIGDGLPIYTRFLAREPVGIWPPDHPGEEDFILSRILVLDGRDAKNSNTKQRYIYIHGTNREDELGKPTSHGCIRMSNKDVMELFAQIQTKTPVTIHPLTVSKAKLLFIDCDSTLSEIEGIDELARLSNPEVFAEVVNLTNAAMNGEVPLHEVFGRRMEIIKPQQSMANLVAQMYIDQVLPGAADFVSSAKVAGWIPIILSGGFEPLIRPLAQFLGIQHVEAVPLYFDADGNYQGYGKTYPTTRNLGKNEIIQTWKKATLAKSAIMIGDGISDLETQPDVDVMVGFGGVVSREKVRSGANVWLSDFKEKEKLHALLNTNA